MKSLFTEEDVKKSPGKPGEFPYTRGIHASMYTKKIWTMRQYAGFGDAESSNARYNYLLSQGTTGLSVAFDLPTQMGFDSDHEMSQGEVGRVGVAISNIDDMHVLLKDLPLETISTSMTINATAAILLCLYLAVAEETNVSHKKLKGTIQNDVLKEYIARGTYIFPPEVSLKITTDIFQFCKEHVPEWNTISISGYHIREAGSTAVQEIAFTLANGLAYIKAAVERGLNIDDFAPRLSFFFNVHNNFFEEIAKFRAARRLWATLVKEKFAPKDPKSLVLRFHAQTAGSTLIAEQVDTNVVRVTLQAMAAVLGGAQSLHTNSRDEALGLPTDAAATLALRTQQVIAYESGVKDLVDPTGGAFCVEALTLKLEEDAQNLIEAIEKKGGVVSCIKNNFQQGLIQQAAYEYQKDIETKKRIVVGLNEFKEAEKSHPEIFQLGEEVEKKQIERLKAFRAKRNKLQWENSLKRLKEAAKQNENILPPLYQAIKSRATLGEIVEELTAIYGRYRP